jgi:hypothetical protein
MTEDQIRNVAADQMAQSFIVEILLSRYFRAHPREMWEPLGEQLVQSGSRTDHFTGLVKNDEEAEVFADVVVKMHDALQDYVVRALQRAKAATGELD